MGQTICFDFDGVIHSYKSGWKGNSIIPDPPVEGMREAIERLKDLGFRISVLSTRCKTISGMESVSDYLCKHKIPYDEIVCTKPPAIIYVDDRALKFNGNPKEMLEEIGNFTTWLDKSDAVE